MSSFDPYIPNDFSSYVFDARMLMAIGNMAMYIITNKLDCTAGLTAARLNVDVPVCLDESAWKSAAWIRGPTDRLLTAGLSRSRIMIRRTSTKLRTKRTPNRIQVGVLGKSKV